jgi:alpha-tubulin suppressor-like RCC1 family protein
VGVTDVARVTIGSAHICALTLSGEVLCWGMNGFGQLGVGSSAGGTDWAAAPRPPLGLTGIVDLTSGSGHSCALTSAGTVWCWGQNDRGQLGLGTLVNALAPAEVPNLSGVIQIEAGASYTCALLEDGTAKCWGANSRGQLGDGSITDRSSPVSVSGLAGVTSVVAGAEHTCARLQNGTAKCWGYNGQGQIGSTTSPTTTPVTVTGLTGVEMLAAGNVSTCARKTDGTIWCWGSSVNLGQLGEGGATSQTFTPILATQLAGTNGLTMGGYTLCGLASPTVIKCIGQNNQGQLGIGTTTNSVTAVNVIW